MLNDSETYGLGIANLFIKSAEQLGIKIAGNQKWDKKASSYESVASRIKASGADGIFLGGIICNNGGKLIKDLKAALPDTQILGPDGWTPIDATIDGAGPAANDMYISQPGIPTDQLTGGGKEFVDAFKAASGKDTVDPYTAYAAQAAVVLLEAIDRAEADRAKVAAELFNTNISDGIVGDFEIDENGDTTLGTVTFFQVKDGKAEFVKTITPETSLVEGGVTRNTRSGGGSPPSPKPFQDGDIGPERTVPDPCGSPAPVRHAGVRSPARTAAVRLARRQPHQDAVGVLPPLPDRAHQRGHLRPRRAGLLARLRHPRADQLRPRRRVHARWMFVATMVTSFGLGDESGLYLWGMILLMLVAVMAFCAMLNATIELVAYRRLRHAPQDCAAHHRDRDVVHPPERRPRLEGSPPHVGRVDPATRRRLYRPSVESRTPGTS